MTMREKQIFSKGYWIPKRELGVTVHFSEIIPFGVLLKLWASGKSDAFLLLLLGFTAHVHTFCKPNHFVFIAKISIRVVCVNVKHPKSTCLVLLSPHSFKPHKNIPVLVSTTHMKPEYLEMRRTHAQ